MILPMNRIPKSKKAATKKPSNSSTAGSMKSGKSWTEQPEPVAKKKRAKIIGSSTKAIKKLNPSSKQTMRRPGLVTSRASGG